MQEKISREEARMAGLVHYFTGKPCLHGHIATRLTSNMVCCECARLREPWHKRHPEKAKEVWKKATKIYRGRNKAKVASWEARRRTGIAQATPGWASIEIIEEIYREAEQLSMQVDHIVPIQHPLVCGLHVEYNLQVISAKDNQSKGNRHWPDMP